MIDTTPIPGPLTCVKAVFTLRDADGKEYQIETDEIEAFDQIQLPVKKNRLGLPQWNGMRVSIAFVVKTFWMSVS